MKSEDVGGTRKKKPPERTPVVHLRVDPSGMIAPKSEKDLIELSRAAMLARGTEYIEVDAKDKTYSSSMRRTPNHETLSAKINSICNSKGEHANILYASYSSDGSCHVVSVFVANDGNDKVAYFTSDIDTRIAYKVQSALKDACKVVMPGYKMQADEFSCGMFAVAQLTEESLRFKKDPEGALKAILSNSKTVEQAGLSEAAGTSGQMRPEVEWDTGSIYSAKSDTKKRLQVRLDKHPEVMKYSQLSKHQPSDLEIVDDNTGQRMESFFRRNFLVNRYKGQFKAQNMWATMSIVDMSCRGDIRITSECQKEMEQAMLVAARESGRLEKINPSLRNAITMTAVLKKKEVGGLSELKLEEIELYRNAFLSKTALDIQEGFATQEELIEQAKFIERTNKDPRIVRAAEDVADFLELGVSVDPVVVNSGRSLKGLRVDPEKLIGIVETSSSSSSESYDDTDDEVASLTSRLSMSERHSSANRPRPINPHALRGMNTEEDDEFTPLASTFQVSRPTTIPSRLSSVEGPSSLSAATLLNKETEESYSGAYSFDSSSDYSLRTTSTPVGGVVEAQTRGGDFRRDHSQDLSDQNYSPRSVRSISPVNMGQGLDSSGPSSGLMAELSPRAEFLRPPRLMRAFSGMLFERNAASHESSVLHGDKEELMGGGLDRAPSYRFMESATQDISLEEGMNFMMKKFILETPRVLPKRQRRAMSAGGFSNYPEITASAIPPLDLSRKRADVEALPNKSPSLAVETEGRMKRGRGREVGESSSRIAEGSRSEALWRKSARLAHDSEVGSETPLDLSIYGRGAYRGKAEERIKSDNMTTIVEEGIEDEGGRGSERASRGFVSRPSGAKPGALKINPSAARQFAWRIRASLNRGGHRASRSDRGQQEASGAAPARDVNAAARRVADSLPNIRTDRSPYQGWTPAERSRLQGEGSGSLKRASGPSYSDPKGAEKKGRFI